MTREGEDTFRVKGTPKCNCIEEMFHYVFFWNFVPNKKYELGLFGEKVFLGSEKRKWVLGKVTNLGKFTTLVSRSRGAHFKADLHVWWRVRSAVKNARCHFSIFLDCRISTPEKIGKTSKWWLFKGFSSCDLTWWRAGAQYLRVFVNFGPALQ